ncbi:MAG: winged helix-turn-helix domain-containing protein [Candidatus Korarchaeota archaeon]|nr:winged helix-turn-helix domain-containing protein [Candidatus Korarchaeota archaeon]
MKALSHPLRLRILALCSLRRRSNRELRSLLGVSKPLLILHLKELVKKGLLTVETEVDEERAIIRKYYRTADFDIHLNREFFISLGRRFDRSSNEDGSDGEGNT